MDWAFGGLLDAGEDSEAKSVYFLKFAVLMLEA